MRIDIHIHHHGDAALLGALSNISKEIHAMSEALTTAIDRLTTEVTETLADVAEKLREIAEGTDDTAAVQAINAQADRLDAFQASLGLPTGEDTAPAPEG